MYNVTLIKLCGGLCRKNNFFLTCLPFNYNCCNGKCQFIQYISLEPLPQWKTRTTILCD